MLKIADAAISFGIITALFGNFAIFGNAATRSEQAEPTARLYTFESNVQSDLPNGTDSFSTANFGFRIFGEFSVSSIHGDDEAHRCSLLYIQMKWMKLSTTKERSDVSIAKSKLESAKNGPFLVHLCNRRVEKIFVDANEEVSIRNLKKAIAGLFQFQTTHTRVEEMDVCGLCEVTYDTSIPFVISKRKTQCRLQTEGDNTTQSDAIFGTVKNTNRQVLYQMDEEDPSKLVKATAYDVISIHSSVGKELGLSVTSFLDIVFKGIEKSPFSVEFARSTEEAVHEVTNKLGLNLKEDSLHLTAEPNEEETNNLQKVIELNRKYLTENRLGTRQSASAFLKIFRVVSRASEEDVIKVLKVKKNEPILNQIMDIFGCAQTMAVHQAVLRTYDFKKIKNIDPIERYLWALSVGTKPRYEFLQDYIKVFLKDPADEKLKETVLLTVAAMAEKLSEKEKEKIFTVIVKGIAKCPKNDDKCISMYLKALKNLKYVAARSTLLHYSLTGSRMVSVNALKAIYSLPHHSWNDEVLNMAEKIYFQKNKVYDSSARAIAIDILVDSNPNYETLSYLVQSLQTNTSYETRKYLLQRLQQATSVNETFDRTLRNLMNERNLFNYDFLAQKGLSNALTRSIFKSDNLNTSIITINEVSKSVLKRGRVSIILGQNKNTSELIMLELFTSGLSSFLWSDDIVIGEEMEEPEELMAGIEVALYGVQMRPFIFFQGHAELLGHIWAGTASQKTPIIQALRLLLHNNVFLPLSTGNVIMMDLTGGISFELTGRITFSIWNRNSHSFGEAKIAASIEGSMWMNTFFMKNTLDVEVGTENEIEMTSDLDFYDEVLFCLQISQTKTIANYKFEQQQTIPNTNYKVEHRKKMQYIIPGRTLGLNKKNNEMCNAILQKNSET